MTRDTIAALPDPNGSSSDPLTDLIRKGARQLIEQGRVMDEDLDLIGAILSNDDNLTYGNIVSVQIGQDDYITALTDDGIGELRDMLTSARASTQAWHGFLEDFVEDPEIIAHVKKLRLR